MPPKERPATDEGKESQQDGVRGDPEGEGLGSGDLEDPKGRDSDHLEGSDLAGSGRKDRAKSKDGHDEADRRVGEGDRKATQEKPEGERLTEPDQKSEGEKAGGAERIAEVAQTVAKARNDREKHQAKAERKRAEEEFEGSLCAFGLPSYKGGDKGQEKESCKEKKEGIVGVGLEGKKRHPDQEQEAQEEGIGEAFEKDGRKNGGGGEFEALSQGRSPDDLTETGGQEVVEKVADHHRRPDRGKRRWARGAKE